MPPRAIKDASKVLAMKHVVAKHKRARPTSKKPPSDNERLGKPARLNLLSVF